MERAIIDFLEYIPKFLLLFVAMGAVDFLRIKIFKKGIKIQVFRELVLVAFLAYLFMIIDITLLDNMSSYLGKSIGSSNFIPFNFPGVNFDSMDERKFLITQIIANVFLFVPFGIALPIILKKRQFLFTLAPALAATLFIEVIQLAIGRVFDANDVVANFAGALIGTAFIASVLGIINLIRKKKSIS